MRLSKLIKILFQGYPGGWRVKGDQRGTFMAIPVMAISDAQYGAFVLFYSWVWKLMP
jgi:hypothetical protein